MKAAAILLGQAREVHAEQLADIRQLDQKTGLVIAYAVAMIVLMIQRLDAYGPADVQTLHGLGCCYAAVFFLFSAISCIISLMPARATGFDLDDLITTQHMQLDRFEAAARLASTYRIVVNANTGVIEGKARWLKLASWLAALGTATAPVVALLPAG